VDPVMLDGLYKVKFRAGSDEGNCVCLFKDGHIAGGGAVMYYFGTFQVSGNRFTAEVTAKRHAKKTKPSPIMGLDEFHMKMEGIYSGGYAQLIGKVPEVPDATLMASLTKLSEM
jgi:hypothetical protein